MEGMEDMEENPTGGEGSQPPPGQRSSMFSMVVLALGSDLGQRKGALLLTT
jgi:hypothetical protein